ncbi:D-alanyl-D-alanine dipeptidase [Allopusillimonas soli]|uniref:D-alanyl-D-alanine dipeptidase n=1 Tax=Allopusillimonas soli TaxID=659016 RepID=A0A853FBI0_9BURK|nr:D-alanyl-D-alanine dipeptidase [Allopusillimonas soli]NYT37279.1 D-alanyl-D-alanine dipeptidase [Allopusillimonas soli]TEA74726.1 D-alanyl-D-alanine dipeptidase [Allopusillimonas soli]
MHATAPAIQSSLVEITAPAYPVEIDLAYAGTHNFTGRRIYASACCALHPDAAACLLKAALAARRAGYTLKIFDAYRPAAAQDVFWALCPDPRYVSDASKGSNHTRGIAVDVTLIDEQGRDLDMGTHFDAMQEQSHHDRDDLPATVQRNRSLLLGIMLQAGFHSIPTEWWHYELQPDSRYPLLDDPMVKVCSP